jgi:hypothetical protein
MMSPHITHFDVLRASNQLTTGNSIVILHITATGVLMFKSLPFIWRRDRRKYPIKRDEHGRLAWQRAFEEFDNGKRPAGIILR